MLNLQLRVVPACRQRNRISDASNAGSRGEPTVAAERLGRCHGPPEALDPGVQNGGSSLNWPRSVDRSVLARVWVARSGLAMAQRRLGAMSSASISATVRFSPSVVSKLRVRSRPTTTARLPLARDSALVSSTDLGGSDR